MSESEKVRVAAVGDIHVKDTGAGEWQGLFRRIGEEADVLVLCGDVTNRGTVKEAEVLASELSALRIPVLAVLGNHDHESGEGEGVSDTLCRAGVHMLEDAPCEIGGVGFAGVKGFAGGFGRSMLEPFGEELIKTFVYEAIKDALRLETSLATLGTERKVGVLHYAPIAATVVGEPEQIFPFLGSTRFEEPMCRFGVAAVVHGHAHRGTHQGATGTGIPVYNVAYPLMQSRDAERPYLVIEV